MQINDYVRTEHRIALLGRRRRSLYEILATLHLCKGSTYFQSAYCRCHRLRC